MLDTPYNRKYSHRPASHACWQVRRSAREAEGKEREARGEGGMEGGRQGGRRGGRQGGRQGGREGRRVSISGVGSKL